ncbi:MAG: response regulator transcription factor [Bacteroidales bacterium]|nr:response regulator transcription factor [Bacteroidales bacterium]
MKNQIKIMVADDHELIHNGVSDCLQDSQEYVIAGHAFSGSEAIVMARKLKPDIILMDISMPDGNGIEATSKILQSQPGIKIIALSQYDSSEYVSQMLQAGSSGYLLKNSRKKEILAALDTVINNKKYIKSRNDSCYNVSK